MAIAELPKQRTTAENHDDAKNDFYTTKKNTTSNVAQKIAATGGTLDKAKPQEPRPTALQRKVTETIEDH